MRKTVALFLVFLLLFCAFAEEEGDEKIIRLQTDPPMYLRYNESTREWDLYDETGIIDSDYFVYRFGAEGSPYVVIHDFKYGYLSADGRWLFEPEFNFAGSFSEGFANVRREENGPWGYVTEEGNWLVEPMFDGAFPFSEGLACVSTGGLYGFIGTDGQYVIEPRFAETDWSFFDEGVCAVTEDGEKWGYIDKQGNWVIEPKYEHYWRIGEGLIAVKDDSGKWGIADKKGHFLTEQKFSVLCSFNEGLCAVSEDGEHWGFIDTRGQWAIEPKYDECYFEGFTNGNGFAKVSYIGSDSDILIDKEGHELLQAGYITFTDEGLVKAYLEEGYREYRITENGLDEIEVVKNDMYLWDYYPFEGSKVAVLDYEADFSFDPNYPVPRLDGATALLPVYAALAQAVYPQDTRYEDFADFANALITCSKTNRAYDRLVDGGADIIFCAG
nr:WG repeat-containing protein [Clostridiales bacterium]